MTKIAVARSLLRKCRSSISTPLRFPPLLGNGIRLVHWGLSGSDTGETHVYCPGSVYLLHSEVTLNRSRKCTCLNVQAMPCQSFELGLSWSTEAAKTYKAGLFPIGKTRRLLSQGAGASLGLFLYLSTLRRAISRDLGNKCWLNSEEKDATESRNTELWTKILNCWCFFGEFPDAICLPNF